ncbi:unnamed protein product [Moneuplotes crassus]|uniref:Golgin subfamily A member 7/ERF4 domain-containing protein n=1 Tax=Euplotes crassus TaxID=5936 RepID=A0AAD1XZV5_EUPCR|nr:unnamed protein product [Moneuplotes crassus]
MNTPNEEMIIHIVRPKNCPFFTGIAREYDNTYPEDKLGNLMPKEEYKRAINRINDILHDSWPCCFIYYFFGFILGYLTFGLTCLIPWQWIKIGKNKMLKCIDIMNLDNFLPHGLFIEYQQSGCHRSCFYIRIKSDKDIESLERRQEALESASKKRTDE